MAGYRRTGAGDHVNATTSNKQMEFQRSAYQARPENAETAFGVYSASNIFPNNMGEIFESSLIVAQDLDEEYSVSSTDPGNPDFTSSIKFDYSQTREIFGNLSEPIDRPNKLGPNLLVPDVNNLSVATERQVSARFLNKGYGWRDERNDPGSEQSTIGTYFKKHYSSGEKPTLGESNDFNDNVNYDQPT